MKPVILLCVIVLFALHGAATGSSAATVNLAGCSQVDVQNAINAAADGDVLVCPSGTWTWTSTATISNKLLSIQGSGVDSTTLVAGSAGVPLFAFSTSHTKGGEITGFKLTNNATQGYGLIRFSGGKGFRIHHNEFSLRGMNQTGSGEGNSSGIYLSYQGATASQVASGVIDHNAFNTVSSYECSHAFIYFRNRGVNGSTLEWSWPSQVATGNNTLFVEDNTFTHGNLSCSGHQMHTMSTHAGAIVVFRHNSVVNGQLDFHGYCGTDGTREYQITDNNFNNTVNYLARWMFIRGGTGYVANNTRTGSAYTTGIEMTEYRLTDPTGSCVNSFLHRTIRGIDVNPPNTCSNVKEGYSSIAQVGFGQVVNGEQVSDPLYFFNNVGGGVSVSNTSECSGVSPSDYIKQNREYFIAEKPGFVEYLYPHPLTLPTGGAATPPSIPTGLNIK